MKSIHPSAVIAPDATIDDDVVVGPNCIVESGAVIGQGCILDANVYISQGVQIGKNNHFFPFATIGCQPQVLGFAPDEKVGSLVIGSNNVIREYVTIHPGMKPDGQTRVGSDNLLMIGVHIGHDCVLEDKIVMSNYSQVAGHCNIQSGVWFSSMVLVHQFITVGRWCYASGYAGINHDTPPFVVLSGHYPPRVRGVNKRGLKRAGLNEPQQETIMRAYRQLYRTPGPLLNKARALRNEDWIDENVIAIIEAIEKSSKQRFGRYLELFRH